MQQQLQFQQLQEVLPCIVGYLTISDVAKLCSTSRKYYAQTSYIVTEWSLQQEDMKLKETMFALVRSGRFNFAHLQLIPRYIRGRIVIDKLTSYVQSQQTDLRHTKKETIFALHRRNLFSTFCDDFTTPSPFLSVADLFNPIVGCEGWTPFRVLYNFFVEPFCNWLGESFVSDWVVHILKKHREMRDLLLDLSSETGLVNEFQRDVIDINFTLKDMGKSMR